MFFEKKIKKMFNIILFQIFTKWYKLATQKLENASQKTCYKKENVGHSNHICLNLWYAWYAMLHMLYIVHLTFQIHDLSWNLAYYKVLVTCHG